MHKIFPRKMRAPLGLKFTVVGDKAVGKTCLLKTYVYGTFPDGPYVSTVFPFVADEEYVYSKTVDYSGTSLLLAMWDRVYSTKEDDSLRSLQFDKTHVFLLCFSVADKTSFENIFTIWQREIKKFCCQTYCLLIIRIECRVNQTERFRRHFHFIEGVKAAEAIREYHKRVTPTSLGMRIKLNDPAAATINLALA
ncbi:Rho-related protein racA [Araneus ventricosus]|uniref:Rho-related protein racA n=1 Tax=Araneus ventricosus TaxID=182803 RepID=A0A4Y2DWA7_ARAVE|nr:Rho-related protein racA [Araneus ventricosus]